MIWDEKKEKALELMIEDKLNDTDIAKVVGCARQTIYDWKNKVEFTAELTRRRLDKKQRIKEFGEVILYDKYEEALEAIAHNITDGSPRNKLLAAIWWAEKIGGKPTTKTEVVDGRENKEIVPIDMLNEEIKEFENE
ncbi:phBC6A51 family helix-turn-helix protein [Clostridium estertheticum]|uniref:phBC6A51 family helix-turn-helix protein n=1 Tax=Clostridium estertheticum TaxID=238834 RepID=UPI00124E2E77|nr:phBC6A51 family helix-turn-helix protein [Clostridium estertheticum]MBZ9615311.1 hypothetical protein [Clostridium estertheticum subsp. laramiense]WAG75200.1 hypothetical protein LL032_07045 [Clostridium estertheticum]